MAITLEQLAERIEGIERRLAALEADARPQTAPMPPIHQAPAYETPAKRYRPVTFEPTGANGEEDAEYFLGAKVLPRVGAAVLVLGIGFLVSLAISRGLLGPWSLFGLALAVCLGFIGIGQRHRDEREQFGELLTGTGVSGLFVTFAAGHAYQNLYSGEVLVAQFFLLSLASLGYSLWRHSTAFLAIGVLGGFIAAAMPLRNDAFLTASVLHVLVLGVATIVASRCRWAGAILSVTTSGFCLALGLAFGKAAGVPYGVGLIYLSVLALVVGWHRILPAKEGETDLSPFAALFLFTATAFAYGAYDRIAGTVHVLGASTLFAIVTWVLYKPSQARTSLWTAAALSAIVLAPIGLPVVPSVLAYPALTLVAALLSKRFGFYAQALGVAAFASGVVRYTTMLLLPPGPGWFEAAYLVLAAVAAISLGLTARNRDEEALGWFAALAALTRLGYLHLVGPMRMDLSEAITTLMIASSLALMILGFARRLSLLRYASFAGFAATVAKVLVIDLATTDPIVRVTILMVLGLVLVGGGYVYIWQRRSQERTRSV